MQRFAAQFDVTIGQNEYVTGGKFNGPVVRLDGFFPLPYDKLKYINLFGTAVLKPTRVKQSDPLILKPIEATVPGANVLIAPASQFNRDYYKIGVGIDFLSLFRRLEMPTSPHQNRWYALIKDD